MINIKRFIDRVSLQEQKNARDVVISLHEARSLRDEIVKLLADRMVELEQQANVPIEVTVKGGTW